ncbi:MAG: hypothetical protein AAGE52_26960 [Myxococcota bacterium]
MVTRRLFLASSLTACASPALACRRTTADIEGPFFRAGAPSEEALVAASTPGAIQLGGHVMDARCRPVVGAILELWQADAAGSYDLDGFHFRTRLRTARDGSYSVTTLVPGRYLNGSQFRPAHIHAKIHTDTQELTTQLYFPGDPYNDVDPWFDRSRLVTMEGNAATFDFVV